MQNQNKPGQSGLILKSGQMEIAWILIFGFYTLFLLFICVRLIHHLIRRWWWKDEE